MNNILLEIILLIGGMFFYGVRAAIGKWLVFTVWRLLQKFLLKTEKDVAYYLHSRNKAMRSKK